MKIGDKVRFLSEKGGGTVAGFQGKNIVLVEDADGFSIPVMTNEVIVVGEDNYDSHAPAGRPKTKDTAAATAPAPRTTVGTGSGRAQAGSGRTLQPQERQGGDKLSVYLAYVPVDIHAVSTTRFETYIVNDSNYFVRFIYLTAEGTAWHLRAEGELEPNTKLFIEEFGRDELNDMQHVCVQLTAYKRDKTFLLRQPVSTQLRIDAVKFYKLNTFTDNLFFEQRAMVLTIVENDQPASARTNLDLSGLARTRLDQPGSARTAETSAPKAKGTRPAGADSGRVQVVDLHAEALLDTTAGLTPTDILNYQVDTFRKTMEQYRKKPGTRIVFIHGKGEGVLRHAIIHELKYRYKTCTYQDASFREYGYGATQVTVK